MQRHRAAHRCPREFLELQRHATGPRPSTDIDRTRSGAKFQCGSDESATTRGHAPRHARAAVPADAHTRLARRGPHASLLTGIVGLLHTAAVAAAHPSENVARMAEDSVWPAATVTSASEKLDPAGLENVLSSVATRPLDPPRFR